MKKLHAQTVLSMPPIKIHDVMYDREKGGVIFHITKGNQPMETVRMYGGDVLHIAREVSFKVTETPNKWEAK